MSNSLLPGRVGDFRYESPEEERLHRTQALGQALTGLATTDQSVGVCLRHVELWATITLAVFTLIIGIVLGLLL